VLPKRVPIPPAFYADDTEAPFEECLVCEQTLRDGATEYVIEKGYRSFAAYDVKETVFGYALCMRCHATLSRSFSAESKRRCQAYLSEHVDLQARTKALFDEDSVDPDRWTQRCIVHGTRKEHLEEYQVLAHCHGEDLLLTHLPFLIGGPAIDELVQRLSNETIDELGGFRDEHFGLPPELKRNPQGPVLA
jgi:ribosomal protein L40E